MKNIIITSGNCIEPIDSVRNIVNSSSGMLGSLICEKLERLEEINSIYYICSTKTVVPNLKYITKNINELKGKVMIIYANSAKEIHDIMKSLLTDKTKNITHVIHARAISDYSVDYVSSTNKIDEYLNSICDSMPILSMFDITNMLIDGDNIKLDNSTKLSSNEDDLIIRLKKTPKIISYIKQWKPDVKLFGFKLLDSVSQDELLDAAKNQMKKCNCDFVIANDISQINNSQHIAHILDTKGNITTCNTKQEIANIITGIVTNNE